MIHVDLQLQLEVLLALSSTTTGNGQLQQTSTGGNTATWSMDEEVGEGRTMKTGPNDASGVVWALGEFFLFLRIF